MRFVAGNDGRVFVVDGGVKDLGTFEWGKPPKAAKLARALLAETLDSYQATAFYMRFMHRAAMSGWWQEGQPWTHTGEEVIAMVDDIVRAAKEGSALTMGGNRERGFIAPEPQLPGDIGVGGNDSAPDRRKR